jgi:hypothetical protein
MESLAPADAVHVLGSVAGAAMLLRFWVKPEQLASSPRRRKWDVRCGSSSYFIGGVLLRTTFPLLDGQGCGGRAAND